jgi:hypothetical protein
MRICCVSAATRSAFMDAVPLCFQGHCHDQICGGTSASTPTMGGTGSAPHATAARDRD